MPALKRSNQTPRRRRLRRQSFNRQRYGRFRYWLNSRAATLSIQGVRAVRDAMKLIGAYSAEEVAAATDAAVDLDILEETAAGVGFTVTNVTDPADTADFAVLGATFQTDDWNVGDWVEVEFIDVANVDNFLVQGEITIVASETQIRVTDDGNFVNVASGAGDTSRITKINSSPGRP